jgi:hypothetical protein
MSKIELNNFPDKGKIIARAVSIPKHQGNVIETTLNDNVYSRVDSEEAMPLENTENGLESIEILHETKNDLEKLYLLSCLLSKNFLNCLDRKNYSLP